MAQTSLKDYRRGNCVCTGAVTQVFRGENTLLEIPVAMKMPLGNLRQDSRTIAMLHREFAVGEEIRHPKIVKMIDLVCENGQTILVSEWLTGRPLTEILREGLDSSAWRVPQIVQDMTEAVCFFNSIGWVHQTLSPDVFMVLEETNETKMIEFPFVRSTRGLRAYFRRPDRISNPGRCPSPEVIRGEKTDSRSDAYSLACIFFEMVTGVPPYPGPTFNQLIHQHLNLPVPSADAVNPNVTPEFAKLLRRTMAKQPTERPASMTEFQNTLKEIRIFKRQPQRPQ